MVSGVPGSFDVADSSAAGGGTHPLRGGGHRGGTCLTHREQHSVSTRGPAHPSVCPCPGPHLAGAPAGVLCADTSRQGGGRCCPRHTRRQTAGTSRRNAPAGTHTCSQLRPPWWTQTAGRTPGSTFTLQSSVSVTVATRINMGFLLSTASSLWLTWKPWRRLWVDRGGDGDEPRPRDAAVFRGAQEGRS